MTRILALAGRKCSGKDTAAKYLKDRQYELWGESAVPRVKVYHFADPLKEICVDVLGLSPEQCWGTDEQKNQKTHILWGNFPDAALRLALKNGREQPMTAREVLQYVGSDLFRKMYPDCWVRCTLRRIEKDAPEFAVVADCRFPNEVAGVQQAGGKAVLLLRSPFEDSHASENSLPPPSSFDAVIDNRRLEVSQTHERLLQALRTFGWL